MQYTKLENKLIGIRKMLPKVTNWMHKQQLVNNQISTKEKLKSSKQYFFEYTRCPDCGARLPIDSKCRC